MYETLSPSVKTFGFATSLPEGGFGCGAPWLSLMRELAPKATDGEKMHSRFVRRCLLCTRRSLPPSRLRRATSLPEGGRNTDVSDCQKPYQYSSRENHVTTLLPYRYSTPKRSASAVTTMPWLSTHGNICSGWRQGASGYVHFSQIAQDSVEST